MKEGTRVLVAFGVAFVLYRISFVFMDLGTAVLIGLIAGGCTWALSGSRGGRVLPVHTEPGAQDDPTITVGSGTPPTAVLGPAAFLAVFAFGFVGIGVLGLINDAASRTPALLCLPVGVVLAAMVVGLWRHSRVAHAAAYLVAGAVGLTIVGLLVAVPMIWSLSTRDAKDWFGVR